MKTCKTCGQEKTDVSFYASNLANCKECVRARVRKRARANPAVQEYDRARAKTPARRAKASEIASAWRQRNPEAYAAQTAVSNAVRDGRLTKEACLFCGRADVHAHHRDYARPLDVTWLCPKCHHRLHANFPESEGVNKRSATF